jgi:hypothetical protein
MGGRASLEAGTRHFLSFLLLAKGEKLIVVSSSAWPRASWPEGQKRLAAFQAAVRGSAFVDHQAVSLG